MPWSDNEFEGDDNSGFDTSSTDDDITAPCPTCGQMIYEDAERCPECGHYLSREDAPRTGRSWWIFGGVAICLLIVLGWILCGQ
jgi:predicted RNA-binding Zn-ribbon protein involved in translation (DUF1610 family)